MTLARPALACAAALTLMACAPSLNWRSVQLGGLRTLLPCKPDQAVRTVHLAGQDLPMEMSGCEADGALFAISRLQANDAAQAPALLQALRQASLAQVQASALHPLPHSGDATTSLDLLADGKRPNGSPLQVRFKWLQAGSSVYQIAAYAVQLQPAQTEPLLDQLQLQ